MTRLAAAFAAVAALAGAAEAACREELAGTGRYAVCEFNPKTDDIRLFLRDADGAPYGEFDAVNAALAAKGESLGFAMNAGMYHKDRSPVGLYVEDGAELKRISTKDGPGNFHLKPNGVFWISADGAAHVTETEAFRANFPPPLAGEVSPKATAGARNVRDATQSGPMLVIDGAIHPKFLTDATSRKRRNGVGVREDGAVVFAISDSAVTFHEFATFFRDTARTPNALYLDGTISRLYAPEIARDEPGVPMGPIIGAVVKPLQ
ncbi:MAG: phosphodiester glycosidase family protein [Parvularculaceae bacterium]|nr:phosphodiester glycosidase family protein [Parvularculaceae bacterium]